MRWLPGALLVAFVLAAAGCGEEPSSDGPTVDVRAGTVDGVGLGDPFTELAQRFGRGKELGLEDAHTPRSGEAHELGLPWVLDRPRRGSVRTIQYDDMLVDDNSELGVILVTVTMDGAHTREGVRIGDDLDVVEERYPDAECRVQNENTEYVEWPYCRVDVASGRMVSFGQDPIRSITIASVPTD